jgi:hypothetical protein
VQERRNWKTRPLQFRPSALAWQPFERLEDAVEEARRMDEQYDFLVRLKHRAKPQDANHYLRECEEARRYQMDANSFVVALRRRGFAHALAESGIVRTVLPDAVADLDIPSGLQQSLFHTNVHVEREPPQTRYSSMFSR